LKLEDGHYHQKKKANPPSDKRFQVSIDFRLPQEGSMFILLFLWRFVVKSIQLRDDFDPLASQREAAMFYGLFLRGHSVDALRKDIDIPKPLLHKWLSTQRFEPGFRDNLKRVYHYRKQVLAIFEELVYSEKNRARLQ
jgi:hypothetical protein